MERHRHSLPDWLVTPLKEQLGGEFWPLVGALNEPAGLDVRVNSLQAKRDDVKTELAKAGIPSTTTPYSPWGLRLTGKPNRADICKREIRNSHSADCGEGGGQTY